MVLVLAAYVGHCSQDCHCQKNEPKSHGGQKRVLWRKKKSHVVSVRFSTPFVTFRPKTCNKLVPLLASGVMMNCNVITHRCACVGPACWHLPSPLGTPTISTLKHPPLISVPSLVRMVRYGKYDIYDSRYGEYLFFGRREHFLLWRST